MNTVIMILITACAVVWMETSEDACVAAQLALSDRAPVLIAHEDGTLEPVEGVVCRTVLGDSEVRR